VTRAILGVDPGVSGGIALVDTDTLVDAWSMPTTTEGSKTVVDAHALAELLVQIGPVRMVVVEALHGPHPRDGKIGIWSLARALGTVHGVVATLGRPLSTVPPKEWQRRAGIGADLRDKARKDACLARARQLWPQVRWRQVDSGRADAALIAWTWTRGDR
jgi:hypothetical protein